MHTGPWESSAFPRLIPGVLLVPLLIFCQNPWRRKARVHLVHLPNIRKSIPIITCISDGGPMFTCIGSLAGLTEKPTMAVDQLSYFLMCSVQGNRWRSWEWSHVPTDSLFTLLIFDFLELVLLSTQWKLRLHTIATAFSIFIHFPVHNCSQSFRKILVSWRLRDLHACCINREDSASIQQRNWSQRCPSILRYLCSLEPWVFFWSQIESSVWNCGRRLAFRISSAEQVSLFWYNYGLVATESQLGPK